MELPEKPFPEDLYVRPVIEEFKTFVQHKIEVLERFRNVEELKVYLDALDLGVKILDAVRMEAADAEPFERTEVEFTAGPVPGEEPQGAEDEEPGLETEEIDAETQEEEEKKWSLASAGEVLMGEGEEGEEGEAEDSAFGEAEDPEGGGTEETALEEGGEEATKDGPEEGDGTRGGVLADRWHEIREEDRAEGDAGGPEEGEAPGAD